MSQEAVELVRSIYRRPDASRFFELLDEEVEVDSSRFGLPLDHPGHMRGKDAVVDLFRHYWGTWDDYVMEATEVTNAGEDRVIVVSERGRGRGSGAPFEQRWVITWTVRAGKIVRIVTFKTRDDGLEAAGIEE